MPEWLKQLLILHGSLGFADTLQQATQIPMNYERMQNRYSDKQLAGNYRMDAAGNPVLGFTPFFDANFAKQGLGRAGYTPVDPNQKFGDYVLGHEFGHAALYGGPLSPGLSNAMGDSDDREALADNFQNAVQFLRKNTREGYDKLSPVQKQIAALLLGADIFKDHAINKQVAVLSSILPLR